MSPTSGALGCRCRRPRRKVPVSREELIVELQTLLGGRAAEQIVFGIATTGASNDIERATELARKMVTQYGMSEKFGLMALSTVSNQYLDGSTMMNCADETAYAADSEIQKLLESCYEQAKAILRAHRELLDEVALYLLQKGNHHRRRADDVCECRRKASASPGAAGRPRGRRARSRCSRQ